MILARRLLAHPPLASQLRRISTDALSRQAFLEATPQKGVTTLRLNRPQSMNAISMQMLQVFPAF